MVAIFDATFVRPIPGIDQPEALVNIKPRSTAVETFQLTSYPNFIDLRDGTRSLQGLAGFHGTSTSLLLATGSNPEVIPTQFVSANYFEVLGVRAADGRFFSEEEDRTPHAVAVISSWLRKERFADSPAVVGREIVLRRSR